MSSYKYYFLFAISFLAMIFIFNFPAPPWPDAIVPDIVARDLLKTGIFRFLIWGDFDQTFLRTNFSNMPLYPFIHVVFLKIFGSSDSRIFLVLNYLLAFLSIINISKILRLEKEHKLLLVLIAFNPLVYHYTNVVRPEWLNIFLLTCIWRVLDSKRSYFIVGSLLALAALNHYFAMFFIPCIVYSILKREETWGRRIRAILIVAVAAFVFMSPYFYYMMTNWSDYKLQLFQNQVTNTVSATHWKYVKSFLVPLFFPSVSFYTLTGQIQRWQVDLPAITVILGIIALVLKWKRHVKLSPITVEAGFFWFFLNLGCSVITYSPYVTVFLSVFVVALLRDIFSEPKPWFKYALGGLAVIGLLYQMFFYTEISNKLFRWKDYEIASECLSQKLPPFSKIYVLAYPDPSVQLANIREDIDIRRYYDFEKYASEWRKIVQTHNYFILSADKVFLNRFDHSSALRNEFADGRLAETTCDSGNIHYLLWR